MRKVSLIIVAAMLAPGLVGCAGQGAATPTPELDFDYVPVVSVSGEAVPAEWAVLSAQSGGVVVAVLVEEGATVAAGDPLVQLDPTDAELEVQQAEAALAAAQAQLALLTTAPRLEEITAAVGGIDAAEAALAQATAERNRLSGGATEAEIAAAEAEVAGAEAAYRAALIRYDDVRARRKEVADWVKEEAALQLRAAEQSLEAARTRLVQVQASAGAQVREADGAVLAAAAQRDIAQAQLDMLQAGATPEQIAVAQAEVARAQVELDAAWVALERCELRAPFAGTIGAMDVRVGEVVSAAQPLITLGDLGGLRVETTDLDEVDVAQVGEEQQVTLSFEGLPERTFTGRVVRISPMAEPGAGGVNYTVVIALDEPDPGILWGMTAFVDIEVE